MTAWPTLSLAEWTVLTVVSERPTHGFAIARLTAPHGELGRIWHIPRPVIYRSIGRLLDEGLLAPDAVESGRGPQRTLYSVTPQGADAVRSRRASLRSRCERTSRTCSTGVSSQCRTASRPCGVTV